MTQLAPAPPPAPLPPVPGEGHPVRFGRVVLSEWTKLRTLRSTYVVVIVAAVLSIGLGALICLAAGHAYHHNNPGARNNWDPTTVSFSGLFLGQLVFGALGVMAMSSEYSTGMMRTSLAAVPRRWRVLAAKSLVMGFVILVVGEVISFASFLIGQLILSGEAPNAKLSDPHVLRAVIGAGLYIVTVALLGVGVGALIRVAWAGIIIVVAVLFVLPLVLDALPDSWRHPVEKYWPSEAGSQVLRVLPRAHTLSPWAGFGVMCLFVAIVLAASFYLLRVRDA